MIRHPARARARSEPRKRTFGQWYGMGKQVKDAVSGIPVPEVLTVPQRGGRVYVGTQDAPATEDYQRQKP